MSELSILLHNLYCQLLLRAMLWIEAVCEAVRDAARDVAHDALRDAVHDVAFISSSRIAKVAHKVHFRR